MYAIYCLIACLPAIRLVDCITSLFGSRVLTLEAFLLFLLL